MKKFIYLFVCVLVLFSSITVFADEPVDIIDNSEITENIITENEYIDNSELIESNEMSPEEESTSEIELLESLDNNLKYFISLIHSILMFFVFVVIYRTLYRLFSFVI